LGGLDANFDRLAKKGFHFFYNFIQGMRSAGTDIEGPFDSVFYDILKSKRQIPVVKKVLGGGAVTPDFHPLSRAGTLNQPGNNPLGNRGAVQNSKQIGDSQDAKRNFEPPGQGLD